MAKKASVEKLKRRQALVAKYSSKRNQLRETIKSVHATDEEKAVARLQLEKLPRDSARVRIKSRCALTGRPRGYLRHFNVSRIAFRELASTGMVPGVVKASW